MSKSTGTKMYRKPPPGIMPHSRQIYGRKKGSDLPYERRFLNALRSGLTVTRACIEAEVAFSTVHSWRTHDPEFKAKWDEAMEQGTDRLEDVARDRAVAGSDRLLIFLLKGRRPEKYRRPPEANMNQAVGVLTPEQTRERLRLLGLIPTILEIDTGDVDEDAAGTAVDADPGAT
jgi:hypothetical protein